MSVCTDQARLFALHSGEEVDSTGEDDEGEDRSTVAVATGGRWRLLIPGFGRCFFSR